MAPGDARRYSPMTEQEEPARGTPGEVNPMIGMRACGGAKIPDLSDEDQAIMTERAGGPKLEPLPEIRSAVGHRTSSGPVILDEHRGAGASGRRNYQLGMMGSRRSLTADQIAQDAGYSASHNDRPR